MVTKTKKIIMSLEGVSKIYLDGAVKALQKIDFSVCEGDFISIIGRSGSGKSTLLHILGLMDSPTEGKVMLLGKNVSNLDEDEKVLLRAKHIGFIFQAFNLLPELNALENVSIAGMINGLHWNEANERGKKLLEKMNLSQRIYSEITKLSGGEKQRVAIARALVNNPEIILADEPTGNLDTRTRDNIMELLAELNEEGRTIIIVTHDLDVAKKARKMVRLEDGMIYSKQC